MYHQISSCIILYHNLFICSIICFVLSHDLIRNLFAWSSRSYYCGIHHRVYILQLLGFLMCSDFVPKILDTLKLGIDHHHYELQQLQPSISLDHHLDTHHHYSPNLQQVSLEDSTSTFLPRVSWKAKLELRRYTEDASRRMAAARQPGSSGTLGSSKFGQNGPFRMHTCFELSPGYNQNSSFVKM